MFCTKQTVRDFRTVSFSDGTKAFLNFEGGDRIQLCSEIWDKAFPKINYYWRDGTFDALEELRTKELYGRSNDTLI
jgi:hypothetical protein